LTSWFLIKENKRPAEAVALYSFGCPKVGNVPFARQHTELLAENWRTCVDGDLVPQLPPEDPDFYCFLTVLFSWLVCLIRCDKSFARVDFSAWAHPGRQVILTQRGIPIIDASYGSDLLSTIQWFNPFQMILRHNPDLYRHSLFMWAQNGHLEGSSLTPDGEERNVSVELYKYFNVSTFLRQPKLNSGSTAARVDAIWEDGHDLQWHIMKSLMPLTPVQLTSYLQKNQFVDGTQGFRTEKSKWTFLRAAGGKEVKSKKAIVKADIPECIELLAQHIACCQTGQECLYHKEFHCAEHVVVNFALDHESRSASLDDICLSCKEEEQEEDFGLQIASPKSVKSGLDEAPRSSVGSEDKAPRSSGRASYV